ncbi:MAG TPA: hypothetical protein PLV06_14820 [Bacteroidales bacterium]|nr:hypothetical protein [Bacteroidales bacterium]HPI68786.1 hypothetical protein [Bacteroidales bacterium]HPR13658.1 hypothetical protein [Bacteroidales bacterium]HRW86561.1 hypothetical protein [Bacteroidales bacterium]
MENEEKLLTGEESLKIITDMINKTKTSIRQSSFHLLFWGWLIFFCSLTEYLLLKFTDFVSPWFVWFFTIPGVIVSMVYGYVKGSRQSAWTYATMLYVWNWIGFLFAATVMFIVLRNNYELYAPLILILASMPLLASGCILKYRPLMIGSATFLIFALAAHLGGPEVRPLAVPAAMLTGYLIPGYMLKRKNDHDTV